MWIASFVFLYSTQISVNLDGGLKIKATLQNLLQKSWKIQAYMVFLPINKHVKYMLLLTVALSGALW